MVDVLVRIYDRGENRSAVVPVDEACFDPAQCCWRTVATGQAAATLGLPFMFVVERARFGLRPEDRARLREMYGGSRGNGGAHCAPLQETGNTLLIQPFGPPSPEGEGLRVRAGETDSS